MTYLNLIPAIVVIAAYFLGRWVGQRSRDIQLIELRGQNQALKTMLDFAQSESEHVAGLLGEKISQAHKEVVAAQIDDGTIYWMRNRIPPELCAECGAFVGVNGPTTETHAIGCKTGAGWMA